MKGFAALLQPAWKKKRNFTLGIYGYYFGCGDYFPEKYRKKKLKEQPGWLVCTSICYIKYI